jgi:hypothetical protein
MISNNSILRTLFLFLLSQVMINAQAQTGLNFQGVARTTNNVILASQQITLRLSILQSSSTGTADYVETREVFTNAQGLFTAVIGDQGAISTLGNFTMINWKLSPKFLKIEMDPAAGTNFITMGTTQFQYVAYAQFAKSVDAENIVGVVPVARGGTGATNLTALKSSLALDKLNNTTDLLKPISTLTQTALDLKLNAADTSKYTKQTYSDSALLTKLSITGNAATATKLATARNINGVPFDGSADITITATGMQYFEKELVYDGENNISLPFSLVASSKIFINGTILKPNQWSGVLSNTLKLIIHTMQKDHLIVTN